ncbi:12073_t:CDS:1, partial [Acaulospora colombiana]
CRDCKYASMCRGLRSALRGTAQQTRKRGDHAVYPKHYVSTIGSAGSLWTLECAASLKLLLAVLDRNG